MAGKDKKPKRELSRQVEDFGSIFERCVKEGSNLSPGQRSFLEDVAMRDLLWYRYGHHAVQDDWDATSEMDHTQRNAKTSVLMRLRNSLSDLALLAQVSAPKVEDVERSLPTGDSSKVRPWISRLDLLDVLDLEDLCTIVGFSVDLFGREYADALEKTIDIYTQKQEEEATA